MPQRKGGNASDWRSRLPELAGLPLLPCGAGKDFKAPIDPATRRGLTDWQTAAFEPEQIAAMNGVVRCVGTRCGPDAAGLLVVDVDGASAADWLRTKGCDPDTLPTWRINRTTDPDRFKLALVVPEAHWPALVKGKALFKTGEREQIELFWTSGQVLLLGEHVKSGGSYGWTGSPETVATAAGPWLALALELLGEPQAPPDPLPPPPAAAPDAVPLEALLGRDQSAEFTSGVGEGGRNDAAFRLAVGLLTAADAAGAAGLPVHGDPEPLLLEFARRCSPPLPEREALTCLRSAEGQQRTPDRGLKDRIRYQRRLQQQPRQMPRRTPPRGPVPLLKALDPWAVQMIEEGEQRYDRSESAWYLALAIVTTMRAAAEVGLPISGDPEALMRQFASRSSMDEKQPLSCLEEAKRPSASGEQWGIADETRQRVECLMQGKDPDEMPEPGPELEGPEAIEYSAPRAQLARLREVAAELIASKTPYAERLPILRAEAEVLGLTIRDQELGAMLTAARRATTGSDQPVMPGQWLDVTPTPWLWENVVMRGRLNLFIALPKQGKTSMLLAGISAHHRNEPAFLDRTLHGPCPPVLIVGTDQGGNDWGQMLVEHGLAERHGDRVRYGAPIVALHHAGAPLHLDPEGIDRIAAYAQQMPGLLIVIDSLSACVAPLGLKEESPQIAEPIHDLMQQVEPHGATVVLIHHAGKGRAGDGASLASRGSTALPAVASQTIKLGAASASPNDPRKLLTTEGRGGSPQALVIKRDGGAWNYIGTAEVLEQEQAEAEGIKGLNDRQADALDLVRERWEDGMQRTTGNHVAEGLGLTGKDPAKLALRALKALERRGFLSSIQTKGGERTGGRPAYEFWPVSDASRTPARNSKEPLSETSETWETSLAPEDPKGSNHCPVEVSDDSDVSDTLSLELGEVSETPSASVRNPWPVSQRTVLPVGTLVEVLIGNPPAWVNGRRVTVNEGSHLRVVKIDDPKDWGAVLPVEHVRPCSTPA
ncbi:AAA family ATPase [Synechococcus sp. CBW1107]|uniref:AAA family ATPase n=1 Tax=Synechococcus sp. CBW1107 TaxID=2789857 RepID=UPI002AD3A969|nr:AAA family ATPase [Synechococcus sp. CBW1107]CAK6692505.1 hypothetical protein ICNINCKA_01226 [Synechococcus sp. CBW1107]